jgi:DNA (cytosine-5)-methyltransferase 1
MNTILKIDKYRLEKPLTCIELCAGAGGQAIGIETAGFSHLAMVEIDHDCCTTLKKNSALRNKDWKIIEGDINCFLDELGGMKYKGQVDLLAGGLPCPPFSIAGKQLGAKDERNLFPAALNIIRELNPSAIMIENVKGILKSNFADYRQWLKKELENLGYESEWKQLNASDFGVPQLRPRAILVGLKKGIFHLFDWPDESKKKSISVGEVLLDLMRSNGWNGANKWAKSANKIAPTIVGGSKKHGGPDLGPTRAKKAWAELAVDGHGIANEAPSKSFKGNPKLTVKMVARLQGFDDEWVFTGGKTAQYRQVGNAFPPPVANAVANKIFIALIEAKKTTSIERYNG